MQTQENKLFLLDAYALIYRAYYALMRTPRFTAKGMNTSAIFGFVMTLEDLLKKENPTHLAVCFDPPGGRTFRHEIFADYKAGRDKQPEDITLAIPYIKRILTAMRIPVVESPDFEADDVIGTLARKAEKEGFVTYMMTPDKDYGQLVTDRTFMYRPALKGQGFEVRGPEQVCERHGISSPEQVIDLLALEGDASDNIPGCPGVGEKTATKLIAEFGSVENLLENTESLKGALQTKITANADQIRLSKVLATIRTDVPVDADPATLVRQAEDTEALRAIYQELEFKSLLARMPQATTATAATQTSSSEPSLFDFMDEPQAKQKNSYKEENTDYRILTDMEEIKATITAAANAETAAVALYAVGPEAMTAQMEGMAVATVTGSAFYIPHPSIEIMAMLFSRGTATIVSHDLKRDILLLKRAGVELSARHYDTSLAHYLLQPEMRHTLADVAWHYLDYQTLDYEYAGTRAKKYPALDPGEATKVICEQADLTLRVYPKLRETLRAEHVSEELETLEQDLVDVLADMEWTGVRIDPGILAEMSGRLTRRLAEMEEEVFETVGYRFNLASPAQVGQVLFGDMKIDTKVKKTKKGGYSTTEEVLEKYRSSVPVVDMILHTRAIRKLLATYIDALPTLINSDTGKIHTNYNQTGTATGRLSSNNPNLQNIPVRTDDGREIRRAFIADPGCLMLSADYSQIELRLMADISGDPDMIGAFAEGADIHRATAAKIYHLAQQDVTDDERRNAKTANFGIIYGISAFGLAERLGIPRQEAKQLIEGYFRSYPKVKEYMENTVESAREKGYVATVMGRRRMIPEINSRSAVVRGYAERNAINAPLQGSAADIIKTAMVRIHRRMHAEGLLSKMIMQVHDELIFNVVPEELDAVQRIVTSEMESAYSGRVPLTVSSGVAHNWLEAH